MASWRKGEQVTPGEFVNNTISLFDGDKVSITVGRGDGLKLYVLPKALLCHKSNFFKAAFQGAFKEGLEQKMTMEEGDSTTFDMLVQCMFTGHINLPSHEPGSPQSTVNITNLLKFLQLADQINFQGSLASPLKALKALLFECSDKDRGPMSTYKTCKEHIEIAYSLPKDYELRQMVVTASVLPYLSVNSDATSHHYGRSSLNGFRDAIMSVPEFGVDFLEKIGYLIDSCRAVEGCCYEDSEPGHVLDEDKFGVQTTNPLTGELLWI